MKKLTILHSDSVLEIFNTLYPFLISLNNFNEVQFIHHKTYRSSKITGKNLLFTRLFKGRFDDHKYVNTTIDKLRERFENICFLDDSAGADSMHFEFINLIDGYYKTKLLVNHEEFNKPVYGRQIFSDYYHNAFDVHDDEISIREAYTDKNQFKKLSLAFNLGYGIYPNPGNKPIIKHIGKALARFNELKRLKPYFHNSHRKLISELSKSVNFESKIQKVSARFRYQSYPNSIGYQRRHFDTIINSHENFRTGFVSPKEYNHELENIFATLSPFGYGEVCLRDFEAVLNGSLLIKPDMSHLKTYPDIYFPNETYIPLKWDGSDLLDTVDNILTNPEKYYQIVENARKVYRESLEQIEEKFTQCYSNLIEY